MYEFSDSRDTEKHVNVWRAGFQGHPAAKTSEAFCSSPLSSLQELRTLFCLTDLEMREKFMEN